MTEVVNRVLDEVLQAVSWRPEDLARELNKRLDTLGLKDRQVHAKTPYKWLNQGKRPYRPLPEIVAALLSEHLGRRIEAGELWPGAVAASSIYVPADRGLTVPWSAEGTGVVVREILNRDFLESGARLLPLAGGPVLDSAWEWAEHEPGRVAAVLQGDRVTPALMSRIERQVVEFHHLDDDEGGGGAALLWCNQEFRFVAQLLNQASFDETIGHRLYVALAELAQVAGWMAYDSGRYGLAQRYFLAGLRAAHLADDRPLAALILSCMAFQATYTGRPKEAIELLETARTGSQHKATPTTTAMLWTWQARAHAEMGDHRAFAHALNTADETYDQGKPEDDPTWIDWMIRPSLTSEIGQAWLRLDQPQHAKGILIEGIEEAVPRDKVLYLAFLGRAHLLEDNLDGAAQAAEEAADIAAGINSPRGVGFLLDLRKRMPETALAVRELDEKLAILKTG